jgi:hypothetical protein
MSRTWKYVIGVIVVIAILVGLGMLRWSNRVYWSSNGERGFSLGAAVYQAFGWGTENYLSDFGRGPAIGRGAGPEQGDRRGPIVFTEEGKAQVAVTLIDDDGDGVPDRGVIDLPPGGAFDRGFGPGGSAPQMHSGRSFGPGFKNFGPGQRDFSQAGGPFLIVGGLIRLAFLALIVGLGILGVYFYRRWRANRPTEPAVTEPES